MDNRQMPDVSGLRLEQAIDILTSMGFEKLTVDITAPPRMRGAGYDGSSRVIRQTVAADGTVGLLVCNIVSE
jgi:beta-lactam-binding protein with PASTA domain